MRAEVTRLVAVVILTCLVATACQTVPTGGPIVSGPVVDAGEPAQSIRVIAAPPTVGATPSEIVSGFLEANASRDSDFEIARQYLTPQASAAWRPDVSTTVYDRDSLELRDGPRDSVIAVMTIVGRVRPNGTLVVVDPPGRTDREFHLRVAVVGGSEVPRWRISDAQPGIVISDVDLGRALRPYDVYYPSARSAALVPERRYLPEVGPSLPTALVERVLAGPSPWLAPSVTTPVPQGTELALGAVPVDDGVAVVDLTEPARTADIGQRRALAAQLTWTLTQAPGVTGVRLRSAGEQLEIPGLPEVMDRSTWQGRSPDSVTSGPDGSTLVPYYLIDGPSIIRVSGADRSSVDPPGGDVEGTDQLAVSLDQRTAASVTHDRRGLWLIPLTAGRKATLLAGSDIAGASFDVDSSVWFTDDGRVRRAIPGDPAQPVPVGSDASRSVSSVRLARDGARLVLVMDGALYLGAIRSEDGQVEVVSLHRIAGGVSQVRDVAWRDAMTLDVIGALEGQAVQALRVPVGGGEVVALRSPSEEREIAAAPNAATLLITKSDTLYANLGLQWGERGSATSVSYPG